MIILMELIALVLAVPASANSNSSAPPQDGNSDRALSALYDSWSPSGAEDDIKTSNEILEGSCIDHLNHWKTDSFGVIFRWTICPDQVTAINDATTLWGYSSRSPSSAPKESTLGNGADAYTFDEEHRTVMRQWIQGNTSLVVRIACMQGESDDACSTRSLGYAREITALQPGTPPLSDNPIPITFENGSVGQIISLTFVCWLLFIAPARYLGWKRIPKRPFSPRGSQRPSAVKLNSSLTIVDPLAKLEKRIRRRRLLMPIVLVALSAWVSQIKAPDSEIFHLICLSSGVIGSLFLRRLMPQPSLAPKKTVRRVKSIYGLCGSMLWLVARITFLAGILALIYFPLLGERLGRYPGETIRLSVESLLSSTSLLDRFYGAIWTFLYFVSQMEGFSFLIVVIPILIISTLLDKAATALMSASMRKALGRDPRPPILYLRSFDEDRLTIPIRFLRRGLIERFSPFRRRRFEEVLVRFLSERGPVIALSPPHSKLPRIGAARASFSNDEWQDRVKALAADASAIVLSATPDSVQDGLKWELDLIGTVNATKLLLVRAPWKPDEVERRWKGFVRAIGPLRQFRGATVGVSPATQVVARTNSGWHCFDSALWTDLTFGVSLNEAFRAADRRETPAIANLTAD